MATLVSKYAREDRRMKNLDLTAYPHVQDSELLKIVRFLPRCNEGGPWIAGGSVWRTIINEPLRNCDIDMFFANKQQWETACRSMSSYPFVRNVLQETKNKSNITYKIHVNQGDFNKTIDVQLINMAYYANIDYLLGSFDFTVCQFAWDGQNIIVNDTSVVDLEQKQIKLWKIGHPKSLFRHLSKYIDNGFSISNQETKKLIDKMISENVFVKERGGYYDDDDNIKKAEHDYGQYGYVNRVNRAGRAVAQEQGEPMPETFRGGGITGAAYANTMAPATAYYDIPPAVPVGNGETARTAFANTATIATATYYTPPIDGTPVNTGAVFQNENGQWRPLTRDNVPIANIPIPAAPTTDAPVRHTIHELVTAQPMDLNDNPPTMAVPGGVPFTGNPRWVENPPTMTDHIIEEEQRINDREIDELLRAGLPVPNTPAEEPLRIAEQFLGGVPPAPNTPTQEQAFDEFFLNNNQDQRPIGGNVPRNPWAPATQRPPRGPARFDEDRQNPDLAQAFDRLFDNHGNLGTNTNNGNETNNQQERR